MDSPVKQLEQLGRVIDRANRQLLADHGKLAEVGDRLFGRPEQAGFEQLGETIAQAQAQILSEQRVLAGEQQTLAQVRSRLFAQAPASRGTPRWLVPAAGAVGLAAAARSQSGAR